MANELPPTPEERALAPDRKGELHKGPLGAEREVYRDGFNELRENYLALIRLLEDVQAANKRLRDQLAKQNRQLEISAGEANWLANENTSLRRHIKRLKLLMAIEVQLAVLMPDDAPREVHQGNSNESDRYTLTSKTYGTLEVRFASSGGCCVTVTPKTDARLNQPFEMWVQGGGFSARQIRELAGALGFSGQFVPAGVEDELRRPTLNDIAQVYGAMLLGGIMNED